jgi:hypothetical protein
MEELYQRHWFGGSTLQRGCEGGVGDGVGGGGGGRGGVGPWRKPDTAVLWTDLLPFTSALK